MERGGGGSIVTEERKREEEILPFVIDVNSRSIVLDKIELTPEDVLALKFSKILANLNIQYCILADYIASLFGRSRLSEDIDFLIELPSEKEFIEICKKAFSEGFEVLQTIRQNENGWREVYKNYVREFLPIQFLYKKMIFHPRIDLRPAKTTVDRYSILNRYEVVFRGSRLYIAPIEVQIAYKLRLGSRKDIGDAVYLLTLFKRHIDFNELTRWARELNVLNLLQKICRKASELENPKSKRERIGESNSIIEDVIVEEILSAITEAGLVMRFGREWFRQVAKWSWDCLESVSYTHLTLPTN